MPRKAKQPKKDRRTYIGELEYTLDMINMAHYDKNPNRAAAIDGWLKYGREVLLARRSKQPLPPRPTKEFI